MIGRSEQTASVDRVREIAQAVLYEGYLLWPYRRSATKNQHRFTFGGVFPEDYRRDRGDEPCELRLQCLAEGDGDARVDVRARFLHLVDRRPARADGDRLEPVDELTVAGERHLAWEEATEREVAAPVLRLDELAAGAFPHVQPVDLPGGREHEWLADDDGRRAGALLRGWQPLRGTVELDAERLRPGVYRLTVRVRNTTPWDGDNRHSALFRAFLSTHVVVRADGGALVSSQDPPPGLRDEAAECRNEGAWPALVGEEGERHTLLAAPIILPDYPQVAPESPGDHFDGTEIDELLVHSIRALTDEEKAEMRATDPRAREILERTASLPPEELLRLHGTVREMRPLDD